jgi:hypothetical protein
MPLVNVGMGDASDVEEATQERQHPATATDLGLPEGIEANPNTSFLMILIPVFHADIQIIRRPGDEDIQHRPLDATFQATDDQTGRPAPFLFIHVVIYIILTVAVRWRIIPIPVILLDLEPPLYFARCVWQSFFDVEGDDKQLTPVVF